MAVIKQLSNQGFSLKDKKVAKWVAILSFVVSFVFYGNTIGNGYAMDDSIVTNTNDSIPNERYIPINSRVVKGLASIPSYFTQHYGTEDGMSYDYRPIASSSFALEYQFFGQNPYVSHFINVLLYGCLILGLFHLLIKLFGDDYFVFSAFVVLLYAAHPIHTEVVASLKSRDEILSFLFSILSFIQAIKYYQTSRYLNVFLSVLFLTIAILSKLSAELFIVIIPASVVFFNGWKKRSGIILIFAMIIPFAILAIINVSLPPEVRYFLHYENPLLNGGDGIGARVIASVNCLGFYVLKLLFPITLIFYYGHAEIAIDNCSNPNFIIGLIVLIAGAYLFFKKFKTNRVLTFGLFFFFATVLAASNLLKLVTGIVAERLVFIGSLGFCILVVILFFKLFKLDLKSSNFKINSSFRFAIGLLVLLFFVRTYYRNQNWKNELTLYRHDAPLAPHSAKANGMLSNHLFPIMSRTVDNQERFSLAQEVIKHYEIAVSIDSTNYAWLHNLASTYGSFQDTYEKAIPLYKKAIAAKRIAAEENDKIGLSPDYPVAYQNIAYIYSLMGQDSLSILNYEKSLEQDAKNEFTYTRYLEFYNSRKLYDKSEIVIDRALKELGKSYRFYSEKGNLYLKRGNIEVAAQCYEDAYDTYQDPKLAAYLIKQYTNNGMLDKLASFKKRYNLP